MSGLHDIAKALYGDPASDRSRLQNAAAACCDCGYRVISDDGAQHDMLCFGRCRTCFMRWRAANQPSSAHSDG